MVIRYGDDGVVVAACWAVWKVKLHHFIASIQVERIGAAVKCVYD